MKRSTVPRITNPAKPASMYALPGERIIEFYDDAAQAGGLISFQRRTLRGGRTVLEVSIYRTDESVRVIKTANSSARSRRQFKGE